MASTDCRIVIHAIFATKDRHPLIAESWRTELWAYIGGTINGLGAKTISVGGTADHAHMGLVMGATHAVADIVREVKKASSSFAQSREPGFSWQRGYAAFSCRSEDIPSLIQYIDTQEEHHRKFSPREEYLDLCRIAGIEVSMHYFE